MRLELATPEGDLVQPDTYNQLFTMHGVIMVFFFLIPVDPGDARQLPPAADDRRQGPRLPPDEPAELVPLHRSAAAFAFYAMVTGGVDTGWTFYTPYSSSSRNAHVVATIVGVFIAGFCSILTGLNFIVTIHTHARPGHDLVPPAAVHLVDLRHQPDHQSSRTPVLAITLVLVAVERLCGVGIFDPALGGDPVLFQHLFWFYSPPGRLHHDPAGHGRRQRAGRLLRRKQIFGYEFVAFASLGIAAARLPRLGPPHVRRRPVASTPAWSSRS